jgi:hypothetical protein
LILLFVYNSWLLFWCFVRSSFFVRSLFSYWNCFWALVCYLILMNGLFFVPWWLSLCLNSFFVLDVVLSCCPLFCIQVAIVVCSLGLLVWACASLLLILFFV